MGLPGAQCCDTVSKFTESKMAASSKVENFQINKLLYDRKCSQRQTKLVVGYDVGRGLGGGLFALQGGKRRNSLISTTQFFGDK